MQFSPARWVTAAAAAALIALPGSALAQSYPTQNPPPRPPTQSPPPSQPPTQTPPPQTATAAPAASGQVDAAAAKQHLSEARDALSQLASMPEAAKLQGDARTKVSELISNFNGLITTQSDWRASYGKVNDSLTALIGPDTDQAPSAAGTTGTATAGTTGTTGTTAAAASGGIQLDPGIRAKLVEFRTHLKAFEKSAGGTEPPASAAPSAAPASAAPPSTPPSSAPPTAPPTAAPPTAASGSMPPAAATGSMSNPANPASATSGAMGTSGSEQTKPAATGTTGSADQNAAAQTELAAIDAILNQAKAGALTRTQTTELRRHVEALRALLNQK